ncbi:uncharacterized protein LOC123701177 [Colias croceus]|uniref:uncharacterized protein LOC123701177 n=1 Tax=Colias crocea TaxID=72248 RepID=UPI001E27A92D|nr:uncharacterized protein LOC123701177 [Colias croceus]
MVKNQYQLYAVDELLAKNYGVEVLRLLPYHCELNPIELIWADVKGHIARNNTTLIQFEKVKALLGEGIAKVTSDRWKKCVEHVRKEEEKFYKFDYIVDDVTDKFIISVTDSDSDSTDLEESASD